MGDLQETNPHAKVESGRVLFVDDDSDLLEVVRTQMSGRFQVETAVSGEQALNRITTDQPFAVIVSDMEMTGIHGLDFLIQAKALRPDSVRIMMTAHANLETALGAVNEGHVFRFLIKPYRQSELEQVLAQAVTQYHLIIAERELLEKTLTGAVQAMMEILTLASPVAFGRAGRLRAYAKLVAEQLRIEPLWKVELAALLSQIGCITIPPSTLAKALSGDALSTQDDKLYGRLPEVSALLIDHIPRLEEIARIIARLSANAETSPADASMVLSSFEMQVAALLRTVMEFDSLISRGANKTRALTQMQRAKEPFDPKALEALAAIDVISIDRRMAVVKGVELNSTMIIRQNLYAKNGHLVVAESQQVTKSMRELIRSYVQRGILEDAISVYLPAEDTRIRISDIMPPRVSLPTS
jgi:CheY-like chemotaxis protein